MKKGISILFFVLVISLLMLSGCKRDDNCSAQDENDLKSENTSGKMEYIYKEGVYPYKMWQVTNILESEENISDSITEEKVISIARAVVEKRQQEGSLKDYVLQELFYDTEDKVWIACFSPEPLLPGACYNIAISKDTGEVLNMWPGE